MYELFDKKKKYEIGDVIKQLDDIAFPPDIKENIYENTKKGINDQKKENKPIVAAEVNDQENNKINDKQNSDNDIEMIENIESNNEKSSSNVENIQSNNEKNSLHDENIPKESKTVVVPPLENQNFEIVNTDWINYSVKKLNRKDNENNANKMRERLNSIEIDERTIMDEINQQKIEIRNKKNKTKIMEVRKKNIQIQGQIRDQKSYQNTKKLNMKEKEKELEKKQSTNITDSFQIKTKVNKDSRDKVKGSVQKEKDSRKSNSQKSGKEIKVVGDSKTKKKNQSTTITDSTQNKNNVTKVSRNIMKGSIQKGKDLSKANTQKAKVSKEKEVKKTGIKKENKEEDEENKLKGDYKQCDNLSDAEVFLEQKRKFEGKMVYNREIVDLKKYFEKSPPITTGKNNIEGKDKYWFMPWDVEYYANPSKKTNDKKLVIADGSEWRMLPVLCVICLTKTTYRAYFSHICNFHPNCYVPEVLSLLRENWTTEVLTVLRSYVKDKLNPFLNDILKINNQFALYYRIAKTDTSERMMKNGEFEFNKFKKNKLVFSDPTKELIESAYGLKKKEILRGMVLSRKSK